MQTYETFEKDLQKYTQYEEAVLSALLDRVPESEATTRETVLMARTSPNHKTMSLLNISLPFDVALM